MDMDIVELYNQKHPISKCYYWQLTSLPSVNTNDKVPMQDLMSCCIKVKPLEFVLNRKGFTKDRNVIFSSNQGLLKCCSILLKISQL